MDSAGSDDCLRDCFEKTGGGTQLRLKTINEEKVARDDLMKRAGLLRRDSVHGSFQGTIRVGGKSVHYC